MYLSMLDNRLDSKRFLDQAINHAWMVGSEFHPWILDLESVITQIVLKSTRDPVLELVAAARRVPSSRTWIVFFLC